MSIFDHLKVEIKGNELLIRPIKFSSDDYYDENTFVTMYESTSPVTGQLINIKPEFIDSETMVVHKAIDPSNGDEIIYVEDKIKSPITNENSEISNVVSRNDNLIIDIDNSKKNENMSDFKTKFSRKTKDKALSYENSCPFQDPFKVGELKLSE